MGVPTNISHKGAKAEKRAYKEVRQRIMARRGELRPWDHFIKEGSPFAAVMAWAWFEVEGAEGPRKVNALKLLGYSEKYAKAGGYYLWERTDVQKAIRDIQRHIRNEVALDASDLAYRYKCMIDVSPADIIMKLAVLDPNAPKGGVTNLDVLEALTPEERYAIKSVNRKTVTFMGRVHEDWYELEFEPRLIAMKQLADLAGLNAPKKMDVESVEGLIELIRSAQDVPKKREQRPAIEDIEWEEIHDEDVPAARESESIQDRARYDDEE